MSSLHGLINTIAWNKIGDDPWRAIGVVVGWNDLFGDLRVILLADSGITLTVEYRHLRFLSSGWVINPDGIAVPPPRPAARGQS